MARSTRTKGYPALIVAKNLWDRGIYWLALDLLARADEYDAELDPVDVTIH